ncbi:MAG: hypothetical protein IPP78_01345 [Holophagaceae bacterium]|nr:hypothetical protein [Holophagaceae bacterium]
MSRPKYDASLFTVRFVGEGLDIHGVSIYDFGTVLLSMQRIVHKAYLAINGRLEHGKFPRRDEREMLSLAIGERKHASDAFALISRRSSHTGDTFENS